MSQRLYDDDWCFCCGQKNDQGLKLNFWHEGSDYVTAFAPPKRFQGFAGVVHGGLIATILDEVMARSLWAQGREFVTAEMTIRLRRPATVGRELTFRARVVRDTPRMVEMEAECRGPDGGVVAAATGKLLPPSA